MVWNTVSATSACHLSEMTRGKFLYNSWSASVSLMPGKERVNVCVCAHLSTLGFQTPKYVCYYSICTTRHTYCVTYLCAHSSALCTHTFCVFFVKRAYVKGISCIDFASGRNKGRWILLLVDHVPVNAIEERMLFQLFGTASTTANSFVYVPLDVHVYIGGGGKKKKVRDIAFQDRKLESIKLGTHSAHT